MNHGSCVRRRLFLAISRLAVVICVIAVPLLSADASARSLAEEFTLHEGAYYYIEIKAAGPANGSDIDASWTSTQTIDMWLMDGSNFERYKSGGAFLFEEQDSGVSGSIRFNVSANRTADEPFYFVLDHSAKGLTAPPAAAGDQMANVSLRGETRMLGYSTGMNAPNPAGQFASDLVLVVAALVPVSLLILYIVLRMKKKQRAEAIRTNIESGNVVGQGAANFRQPPASGPYAGAPYAGAPPYAGPPAWGSPSPVAPAPYPSAAPAPCRSCGSPQRPGIRFCGNCGAPV